MATKKKDQTRTVKTYVTTAAPGLSPAAQQLLHEQKVVEHLMQACGERQISLSKAFASTQDFQAHVLHLFPAPSDRAKKEQLKALMRAIHEAKNGNVDAAARCIGNCIELGRVKK